MSEKGSSRGAVASGTVRVEHHEVPNGDGWMLSLHRTWDEEKLVRGRHPVLIVPGYGMNSFIFSFHPSGLSLEGYLVERGFEVWRADLRGQGDSRSTGGSDNYGLWDLAMTDVGAAVQATLEGTGTGASRVDVIGASLGGSLMFIHAAMNKSAPLGKLIAMGTPVRWVKIHPALRVMFGSPAMVGLIKLRGSRRMAEVALPRIVKHAPWLLSIYMNPEITDTSAAKEMVKTVEDPNRFVNKEIASWIRGRDLVVRGTNIAEAVRGLTHPLLCVVAASDGIVPPETASFAFHQSGSRDKALLEVGDADMSVAHADLFLCKAAHERVFRPMAEWLAERGPDRAPPE